MTGEPRDRIYFSPFGDQRYGVVTENPMRYSWLPIEAKGMYAYLCVVCAASSYAPSVKRQLQELSITKVRYYKYRGMLEEAGLLRVEKGRRVGRRWECNTYYLAADVSPEALFKYGGAGAESSCGGAETAVEKHGPEIVEKSKPQVSEGFDFDTPQLHETPSDCGKPEIVENPSEKPQVSEGFDFETPQNRPTISRIYNPTNSTSTSLEEGPTVENPLPAPDDADVLAAFDSMLEETANRNSIRNPVSRAATLGRFRTLVEKRSLDPWAVEAAWSAHQERRRAVVSGDEYMPNLARWLSDDTSEGALAETLALQAEGDAGAPAPDAEPFSDAVFSDREVGDLFFAAQDARRRGDEGEARSLEAEAWALFRSRRGEAT